MKIILEDGNHKMLRFDRGEEVLSLLKAFCTDRNIQAGAFQAIGAVAEVTISYYDLQDKKYIDETIAQDLEIISVLGNISILEAATVVHAHGSFSDRSMQLKAGHVKQMIVSATCELALTVFEAKIERAFDDATGLNLIA